MEHPTNGTQIVDGLRPLAVPDFAQMQVPPVGAPVQNTVVQSLNDIQPQGMSERVLSVMLNRPVLFRQGDPNAASGASIDSSIVNSTSQLQTGVLGSSQVPHPSDQLSQIPQFKQPDPSNVPPTVVAVTSVVAAGPQVSLAPGQHAISAVLAQPPIQYIIDKINAESVRSISDAPLSNSLLTSLNAQTQPASRFRKARIHETVEQWSSNRLSLHDCRLKAVPDWVSYIQSKPMDISFNCPIAQRGRCLYCFVPGGFGEFKNKPSNLFREKVLILLLLCFLGSHCNNPKHNQSYSRIGSTSKHQKNVTCSLPTVPETSELSHILQATFTAYRAASQKGYNLSSLLSKWNSGERVSSRALLEQVDQSLLSKKNFALKANASEPVLISATHLEVAGHNSTDANSVLPLGNEDFCKEGLTIVVQPGTQAHHPLEMPTVLEQLKAPPNCASPSRLNPNETSDRRITDPSAAYLRHQITVSSEEGEAVCSDGTSSSYVQSQPPDTLTVAPSGQRFFAPPPTSPTLAPTANHLQPAAVTQYLVEGTAAVSPRTLDSMPSFSGTSAPSAQLSPDTEPAGLAIPRAPDLSSVGSSRVTTSSHNMVAVLAAAGPM